MTGLVTENGIFAGLLLLIIGVPLICSPYTQNDVFLIKTVFFQSLVFALFILLLSKKFLTRGSFSRIPLTLQMCVFLGFGLLSFVLSPYRHAVLEEFLRFLSFFLLYVLVVEEVRGDARKQLVIDFLTFVTLIVTVYGILQRLDYNLFGWVPTDTQRIPSFFGNPNFFASYLVAVLPLLFVLSLGATPRRRLIAVITLGSALICLAFTATRSAWVGFVLSFAFLLLLVHAIKAVKLNFKLLLPLTPILAIILFTLIYHQDVIINRMTAIWSPRGSASQRLHIWGATLDMIKSSPILGTGLGTFHIEFPKFRYPGFGLDVPIGSLLHAHNEYLEIWSEMGLVGLAIFLWLVISFMRYAFRFFKSRKRKRLVVAGLVSGLVGVLIGSFFSVSLRWTGPAFIFWLIFGLTVAMIGPRNLPEVKKGGKARGKLTHLGVMMGALICIILITRWHVKKYEANIFLAKAQPFLDSGRKSDAILQFKEALEKDPYCLKALYLMGCLNVEKKDFDEAKMYFEKLERLAPDFANIHEWKGYLLFQLRHIPEAEDEYRMCTEAKPTVFNHNMLGRIYALQKKWDLAIGTFRKACQLGAEAIKTPKHTSTFPLAQDEMNRSVHIAPVGEANGSRSFEKDQIINAHILLAKAYYEIEKYDESFQQVDKILSQDLSNIQQNEVAQLYNNVAWNHVSKGAKVDEALELCQRALALNSLHPELIHDTQAWIYFKQGRFKSAKAELDKAIRLVPENEIFRQHRTLMQEAIEGRIKNIDMKTIR